MTQRQVFERVRDHLLQQGRRSRSRSSSTTYQSMYRGNDGLRCAVGCLIRDDAYDPDIEGRLVYDHGVVRALCWSGVPTDVETLSMLSELQNIHDGCDPREWRQRLEQIERRPALTGPADA